MQILAGTGGVHQDHRCAGRCDELQAARIVAQGGNIIDDVRARLQRGFHHRRAACIHADGGSHAHAIFDRGLDALDLFALPHLFCPGPRALTTDIDDRRASLVHGGGVRLHGFGIVHQSAAIGKAVRRDVENTHNLRHIEADGAAAQFQRRVRHAQVGPLLLTFHARIFRHCGKHIVDGGLCNDLAFDHPAIAPQHHRKFAGVNHPTGKPHGLAFHGLRARNCGKRLDVYLVGHLAILVLACGN